MKLLIQIVLAFMKIGAMSFGGAYAAMPLIQKQIVEINQWMSLGEFRDLIAIDELTPGPILINSATYIGMKLSGIPGAVAASIGCIIPSFVISLILIGIYRKYRRVSYIDESILSIKCLALAMIISTFLTILLSSMYQNSTIDIKLLMMAVISFFLLRKYRINPVYLMLGCGTVCFVLSIFIR
ncbi:MAG: chromate transporter [Erysipelotrichaceae bacterium]|nr:chromate transporter [Erysipelotrichaceae bacterium]